MPESFDSHGKRHDDRVRRDTSAEHVCAQRGSRLTTGRTMVRRAAQGAALLLSGVRVDPGAPS